MKISPFAPLYPDIYWYRPALTRYASWMIFVIATLQAFISFFTKSTFTIISIIYAIYSLIPLLFIYFKKFKFALILIFSGYSLIILIRSYMIQSAFLFFFSCLMIIGASIISNLKITTIFFAINLCVLLIYAFIGVLSFTQEQSPEGIYYANTITVVLPAILLSYVIAFVISKVLVGMIKSQVNHQKYLQEAEDALIDREKMNTIRVLAGGIAHDFNNILAAILGNLQLVDLHNNPIEENQEYLQDLEKAIFQAKAVANQLLSFSRPVAPQEKIQSPLPIIREMADFTLHGKQSRAEYRFSESVANVSIDRHQFSQVIQNLVLNADQSMPKGGIITITVYNCTFDSYYLKRIPLGDYVCINIKDQGIGMTPEQMEKIFTPFYTTKQTGSGLGLAISLSIITNHRGYILAESEIDKGSSFSIYLPATNLSENEQSRISLKYTNFSGLVMILDDNQILLKTNRRILSKVGFHVESFTNPEIFLSTWRQHISSLTSIACILIDLTIPGNLNGLEIIKLIRDEDLTVKIILLTGYPSDQLLEKKSLLQINAFLQKPYTKDELLHVLNSVINSEPL